MKIAIVSSFDLDGGAARAASRLHAALREQGCDSRMFVQVRTSHDATVDGASAGLPKAIGRLRPLIDHAPAKMLGSRLGEFSLNWLSGNILSRLRRFNPDIVHLHWINGGFISINDIASLEWPVIWTAHDMWPFTGGCHYDQECGKFAEQSCASCPMLPSYPLMEIAHRRLLKKAQVAAKVNVTFVAPSRWMADVAQGSPVGKQRGIHVIPNGVDLNLFKPIDKSAARQLFSLPSDKTILAFGAVNSNSDPRKGFTHLDAMLRHLSTTALRQSTMLCVFGTPTSGAGELHGIPVRFIGHLHDDVSLVALYSAADVFVAPSLQDNLPNTVLEATACGTPSIGFNVGGMSDLIDNGCTGILVDQLAGGALAERLLANLKLAGWLARASVAARRKAELQFSSQTYADAHLRLYKSLLNG